MCEIRLEQVSKIYNESGGERTAAVTDASFVVERGEFVAVTGSSGCGKSTLLHMIGGLLAPTSGRILVEGASLYEKRAAQLARYRRRYAGFVYQFYNLVPELNVRENLILPARMDHRSIDGAWAERCFAVNPDFFNHGPPQCTLFFTGDRFFSAAFISHSSRTRFISDSRLSKSHFSITSSRSSAL